MVNVILVRQIHLHVRVENLLYKLMRVMRRVEQQFGIVKVKVLEKLRFVV